MDKEDNVCVDLKTCAESTKKYLVKKFDDKAMYECTKGCPDNTYPYQYYLT